MAIFHDVYPYCFGTFLVMYSCLKLRLIKQQSKSTSRNPHSDEICENAAWNRTNTWLGQQRRDSLRSHFPTPEG